MREQPSNNSDAVLADVRPAVRAIDVPDIRLKFISQWGASGFFRFESAHRAVAAGQAKELGLAAADRMEESIKFAEMFWVAPTFLPLLLNAADSMPLDAKYSELPPLPDHGLLVFDAPGGWIYSDQDPQPDVAAISWASILLSREDGRRSPGILAEVYGRFGSHWLNLRSAGWAGDDPVTTKGLNDYYNIELSEEAVTRIQRDRKILAAFSHLITQTTISDTSPERMPRPVQKRSERKNVPSTVRVVRLRHLVESEKQGLTSGSNVEYSHQWLVSGHWRNQPCGIGLKERKLIWVNPHVKGPADKPLVLKETVKALVR